MLGGELEDFFRTDPGVQGDAFEKREISLAGDAAGLPARGHGDGAAVAGRVLILVAGVGLVQIGKKFLRLGLFAAAVDPAVELGGIQADARIFHRAEGFGLGLVEADADGRIRAGAGVVEITAEPAGGRAVVGVAGLPDGGRDEVGAVRIRIADALHDAEVAFLEQGAEERHGRVQADMVVEPDDFLFLLRETRTGFMIGIVAEGDERVESVVPAGELEHDEDSVVLAGDRLDGEVAGAFMELAEGTLDEHRDGPGGGCAKDGGAEKVAAGFHGFK